MADPKPITPFNASDAFENLMRERHSTEENVPSNDLTKREKRFANALREDALGNPPFATSQEDFDKLAETYLTPPPPPKPLSGERIQELLSDIATRYDCTLETLDNAELSEDDALLVAFIRRKSNEFYNSQFRTFATARQCLRTFREKQDMVYGGLVNTFLSTLKESGVTLEDVGTSKEEIMQLTEAALDAGISAIHDEPDDS